MIRMRVLFSFLPAACLFLPNAWFAAWGQETARVPSPGEYYSIHHSLVTEGTQSLEEDPEPLSFRQTTELDFSATVLPSASNPAETRIRFLYQRALLSLSLRGATATLEILPDAVVLDGTPLFQLAQEHDDPVSLPSHWLNENFVATLDREGELVAFEQDTRNRHLFSFLDLATPIRSLLGRLPEGDLSDGREWPEEGPMVVLSGILRAPAKGSYRLTRGDQVSSLWVVSGTRSGQLEAPSTFPTRIGLLVPFNLRYDLLGPDLFAEQPPLRVEKFSLERSERLEFRADWGFPSSLVQSSTGAVEFLQPQVDGTRRLKRTVSFDQKVETAVQPEELPEMSEEVRALWLGDGSE
jgi:hypothetical protein